MRHRRTSIEIIAEILSLGRDGAGKTSIMYNVNMSHTQLMKYMDFLVRRGFLQGTSSQGATKYRTTAKGRELLKSINRMAEGLGLDEESMGAKS